MCYGLVIESIESVWESVWETETELTAESLTESHKGYHASAGPEGPMAYIILIVVYMD